VVLILRSSRDDAKEISRRPKIRNQGAANPSDCVSPDFGADTLARVFPPFARRGLAAPAICVRSMRKRWGSLSRNGRMTLNSRLIEAPQKCIEYVVVHELCHLIHHDHSPQFLKLLSRVMPDWEKRKARLEQSSACTH
jgi:hypothetical protein